MSSYAKDVSWKLDSAYQQFTNSYKETLILNAEQAEQAGQILAFKDVGFTPSFDLVNKEALEYSAEYASLLKEEGATIINGKKVAWFKDGTEAMRDQVNAIITEGLADGVSRDKIAESLKSTLGAHEARAQMIAYTESKRCMSQGTLLRYEKMGLEYVTVIDDHGENSCYECMLKHGQVWTIREAKMNELEHPWCVRTFVAKIDDKMIADAEGEFEDKIKQANALNAKKSATPDMAKLMQQQEQSFKNFKTLNGSIIQKDGTVIEFDSSYSKVKKFSQVVSSKNNLDDSIVMLRGNLAGYDEVVSMYQLNIKAIQYYDDAGNLMCNVIRTHSDLADDTLKAIKSKLYQNGGANDFLCDKLGTKMAIPKKELEQLAKESFLNAAQKNGFINYTSSVDDAVKELANLVSTMIKENKVMMKAFNLTTWDDFVKKAKGTLDDVLDDVVKTPKKTVPKSAPKKNPSVQKSYKDIDYKKRKDIPDDVMNGAKAYQSDYDMNREARAIQKLIDEGKPIPDNLYNYVTEIQNLDKLIKQETLNDTYTLYRGLGKNTAKKFVKSGQIADGGYQSFSYNLQAAKSFTKGESLFYKEGKKVVLSDGRVVNTQFITQRHLMVYETKVGENALYIGNDIGEAEILFGRNKVTQLVKTLKSEFEYDGAGVTEYVFHVVKLVG